MPARCAVILGVVACASPRPASPLAGIPVSMSTVEWRAKASDDPGKVDITLVVDGQKTALGALDGAPETCALRRAEATATELVCERGSYFAAELVVSERSHELVVRDGRHEIKRIPIGPSEAITVAPYAMPAP